METDFLKKEECKGLIFNFLELLSHFIKLRNDTVTFAPFSNYMYQCVNYFGMSAQKAVFKLLNVI